MDEHFLDVVHPGAAKYTPEDSADVLQAQRVNIDAAKYIQKNIVPDDVSEPSERDARSFPRLSFEGEV